MSAVSFYIFLEYGKNPQKNPKNLITHNQRWYWKSVNRAP